jgi:hypothetical protein
MRKRPDWLGMQVRTRLGAWLVLLQSLVLSACDGSGSRETLAIRSHPRADANAGSSAPSRPESAPVTKNMQSAPVQSVPPICTIACSQLAVLKADLPAEIDVARHWRFEACRNETCFEGRENDDTMIVDGVEGQYLYFVTTDSAGMSTSMVSIQLKRPDKNGPSSIEVSFEPQAISAGGTMPNDQYVIRAKDEDSGTEHELLNESVKYNLESRQIGENCSLSCWHGRVDSRKAFDADAGN